MKYIKEYKKEIMISFCVFILAYSIKLFTYSYGIDTEIYMFNRPEMLNSWLAISRFSLVFFKEITTLLPFHIPIINALTIMLFYISVLFSYYNITLCNEKIHNKKNFYYYMFTIGTSAIFLEQFYFTLQSLEVAFFLIVFELGIFFLIQY